MRTLLGIVVLHACLLAQSPTSVFEKAPPDTDNALRARVETFFKAHITGRFRDAETVIAEDSKDAFYNSEKRKYISYEIVQIQYSEQFQKAVVVTAVEMDWYTARLGKMRVKPPMKSLWKVENGQWVWYVVPQNDWDTPFGRMKPGADPDKSVNAQWTVPDAKAVLQQVKVSKNDLQLVSHEKSSDFAEITNGMPGDITLRIDEPALASGLEIKLDRQTVKSGETARLEFHYQPPDRSPKRTLQTTVTVEQTGEALQFRLTFAVPPEFEKYLQKKAPAKP